MISRFCKLIFSGTKWSMNEFPWFWWIFRAFFSKNADGSKRFLMVFWSVSKKWIYIIDQEMKSGFWSTGSELFLADRQGEDCCNGSFVIVGWWIMLWKKPFQTSPLKSLKSVKISEIHVFPIHSHAALSKTNTQIRIVILREAKWSRRIYRKNNDGFCNSGRKRPPCRMTPWITDSEFKGNKF